jgi:RimJ/RimL family protein N-acetyltransferase
MADGRTRTPVRLRLLVTDDAQWACAIDRAAATPLAPSMGWEAATLAEDLATGTWAGEERFAWAVTAEDGDPVGFALVTGLEGSVAEVTLRIDPSARGRGIGREVLRRLADHHFADSARVTRLTGRAHERNVPMQRVFNAAGFRMEARYRDSATQADGTLASEWGYALTRADWQAGRHLVGSGGVDLHGLTFTLDETTDGPVTSGLTVRFLQEGRRAIARYDADDLADGELAGIVVDDLLEYRYVHLVEEETDARRATGRGRCRVQRRGDGRLELIDLWSDDDGSHGRRVLIEVRA